MGSVVSGSRIGRYVVVEELGGGGNGVVYRARDSERVVALKVLRLSSPEAVRRMRREARATQGLDPRRVAQVYEVGETPEGQLYLAMEYVPGATLREILRSGPVERGEALRVLGEIAATLGEAHRAGVVHRDVKPENVIVRSDGAVVLLDFGIAKYIEATGDTAQATTQLTSEGMMIGTPAYLAPEQALGNDIGPAVDQFALAVTAFELLTGKLPWTATEVTRMLAQLLADTPPAASAFNQALPRPYDAVLWRALSKLPSARFSSVEQFADALRAAERGEVVASPASQSVEGPVPPDVARTQAETPGSHRGQSRLRWALGVVAVGLLGGGGAALVRARVHGSRELSGAVQAPPALAISSASPLACPIFDVDGASEFGTRIGAAAASLACGRAKWYLGGRDDRILPPAALLDAPVELGTDVPDLYGVPGQRAKTLAVVQKRGLSYLDGKLVRDRGSWRVDLSVRAPNGAEVAHVAGLEADQLLDVIKRGVSRLWEQPLLKPASIDPEVARWTALPDIEAGLTEVDLLDQAVDREQACGTVERRGAELGSALFRLGSYCDEPAPDASAPAIDETSPAALVSSLMRPIYVGPRPPKEEQRRLAQRLEDFRAGESSRLGRAYLADMAGTLWTDLAESDRAKTAFLAAIASDPLLFDAWTTLETITGSTAAFRALASAWFPYDPAFLNHASSGLSDELELRLHDTRLAYLLFPNLLRVLYLGRALAEAGQEDEARALTAITPAGLSAPDPNQAPMLLGFVDLHDAKLARALERFAGAGFMGLYQLPIVAHILGRERSVSAKWASAMLAMGEAEAQQITGSTASIALCMSAGRTIAVRCLARAERLRRKDNLWGANGDALLRGAQRYAVGDLRGAVDAWRPVVGGPDDDAVRVLPTEPFERVGEDGLAARVDARKMKYRYFAGLSDATPSEARRAFEHGDLGRARELAQKVVDAWEVADAVVPAVGEMKALLAKVGAPQPLPPNVP